MVDYQYTLKQAIGDKVCRAPKIVLVDNEHLTVSNDKKVESFSSILEMIKQTKTSYQSIIHNKDAMEHLLGLGCKKLAEIRSLSPSAGGLVVAASVKHAQTIKKVLSERYAQSVSIVTYRHEEPLLEIERYTLSETQWIVSVGMISEGTDIPRLQVCCHMSSVKTELYFRQVLGRILRVNGATNQQAWLFTFAEQSLIELAERIEQDIPEPCMYAKWEIFAEVESDTKRNHLSKNWLLEEREDKNSKLVWNRADGSTTNMNGALGSFDELQLGAFRQRVISAFLSVS